MLSTSSHCGWPSAIEITGSALIICVAVTYTATEHYRSPLPANWHV